MVNITGSTQLLGVIGCPIHHSLSPALHNAALLARALAQSHSGLEYVYVPLEIDPANLGTALAGMAAVGWCGFNVTIPHKQSVMAYLQEISPLAQAIGAVNTVWRASGVWHGTNTDVQGFKAPLLQHDTDWAAVEVCLLGAGGASRAVIAACAQLNCRSIHVVGRNQARLDVLQQDFADALQVSLQVHSWQALEQLLPRTGLLVNATPLGMHPEIDESPLTPRQMEMLSKHALVYDLIYRPRPTRLLHLAQQHGCVVIDGLEMLIQQGAAAFEIWVGEAPSLSAMRKAAVTALETAG